MLQTESESIPGDSAGPVLEIGAMVGTWRLLRCSGKWFDSGFVRGYLFPYRWSQTHPLGGFTGAGGVEVFSHGLRHVPSEFCKGVLNAAANVTGVVVITG